MKAAEVQSVPADRHARMVLAIVLHRQKDIAVGEIIVVIAEEHQVLMTAIARVSME